MRNYLLVDEYVDGTDYDKHNWKPIPGYNGLYEISIDGEVRTWKNGKHGIRKTPKKLTPYRQVSGRMTIHLEKGDGGKTISIARLMAIVFLGGIPEGKFVGHKNGDITDNCLNNIVIIDKEKHYKKYGGHIRKPVLKIDKNGEIIDAYRSITEAAKKNFMCQYQITLHCKGAVKNPFKFQDYTFRFDE